MYTAATATCRVLDPGPAVFTAGVTTAIFDLRSLPIIGGAPALPFPLFLRMDPMTRDAALEA